MVDGKKTDIPIHEQILAEGDERRAKESTLRVLVYEEGWPVEKARKLLGL